MPLFFLKRILPFVFLICLITGAAAQTRSNNVQTYNGKKVYIHVIEKKQSLYSIAKLYNVSLDEIYNLNPEARTGTKAGQEIKIPFPEQTPAVNTKSAVVTATAQVVKTNTVANTVAPSQPADTSRFKTYTVGKKETLYAIAKKFNLTEAELKILNPVLLTQSLKEGQVIVVGEQFPPKYPVQVNIKHPDSIGPVLIHKTKKNAYTLAMLLPFKLDETINLDLTPLLKSNSNFPAIPTIAVDFYMGFKRAADSLHDKDFDVLLNLYDIDDKDSARLAQIVKEPSFNASDLIVGPLYTTGFKTVAQKAKEKGTGIISPLTQQNKMLYDNVYTSKTNPSQFTLLESLADYCMDSLAGTSSKFILVSSIRPDAKELSYIQAFKSYYKERRTRLNRPVADSIVVVKGLAGVKASYAPNVKNILVMLSNNQVFIADFTTQLAIFSDKKDIVLCGWQQLSLTENIDQEYLNQLRYTFPCENNILNTASYSVIATQYKDQMNTMPGEYYYIGFDIGMYYLKNLKAYGPDFIFNLDQLNEETNYMRFRFSRPDKSTGFDNRGVYIFRYNNYKLEKTGWK